MPQTVLGKAFRRIHCGSVTMPPNSLEAPASLRTRTGGSFQAVGAISGDAAIRVTNTLLAAASVDRDGDQPLRVETVYDEERARMKIVVLGGVAASADLLRLIDAVVDA
jgi:hypothetical protein